MRNLVDDGSEPPTDGPGFGFTDALEEFDLKGALELLAEQEEITPEQISDLRDLFENPPGPENFTTYRLEYRHRRKGAPRADAQSAALRVDLDALHTSQEREKLILLLSPGASLDQPYPLQLKLVARRRGRKMRTDRQRAHEFVARLASKRAARALAQNDGGEQGPKQMKQHVAQLQRKHGLGRTAIYDKFGPRKKDIEKKPK